MRYWVILAVVLGISGQVNAQARINLSRPKVVAIPKSKAPLAQIGVAELISMLDWDSFEIDTTLKRKGYLLMQKDVDSTSSLFQYSNVTRKEEAPVNVRSVSYMEATIRDMKGKMLSYRTYDKEEFRDISGYLLANNYQQTNKFDFDDAQHTLYSNGKQEIRLKVITTEVNKRKFVAYEIEIGK